MISLALLFEKELVFDLFADGVGASSGIAEAYREPHVVVHHNPIALAMYRANHLQTEYYLADSLRSTRLWPRKLLARDTMVTLASTSR
ncbi:hypothetical protein [Pseudomonas asiatica]|uniref:Uncharacterized protein n=1 Tax=Pseudomonas asiatica TaxID=2219225 RepID=A0A9X4D7S4_9PSED|nr:hypothetical protein [Pseudomonas asiatica]MDD2109872.1 hypothetical protein [Pseudomonas asiatica]MDM9587716.1 hypothetical protein [Pseudomonas asiatica]